MVVIPVTIKDKVLLIFVLEKSNLERMKTGDPVSIPLNDYGMYLVGKLRDAEICICYEENLDRIRELQKTGNIGDLVNYLMRGWQNNNGDGELPRPLN